jgi:hypothetical protein
MEVSREMVAIDPFEGRRWLFMRAYGYRPAFKRTLFEFSQIVEDSSQVGWALWALDLDPNLGEIVQSSFVMR